MNEGHVSVSEVAGHAAARRKMPVSAGRAAKGCAWRRRTPALAPGRHGPDVCLPQGPTQPSVGQTALSHVSRHPMMCSRIRPMEIQRIPLLMHGDSRGMLIALEQDGNVPFVIRRVYYIFATRSDVHRGRHAHRHLTQLAVAVRGSVTFLLDDGSGAVEVVLDDPSQGLLLGSMVWRELYDFSDDCVLMVLADHVFDRDDYITDYAEFLREVNGVVQLEGMTACQGR
jgi:dTDP-4-dehydrorhamnose 3,5-epimerase-like enzyme